MATNTVLLEPATVAELTRSLNAELPKDILVRSLDVGRLQIETPVSRLSHYHFTLSGGQCSWTTPKRRIVLQLDAFSVIQRAEKNVFSLELKGKPRSTVKEIFVARGMRALEQLETLDEESLREAVKAPTDCSVLVAALNSEKALADPLAAARIRGIEAKRQLLELEGGTLSSPKVAELLDITRQAVDKRRHAGKLLAVELGKKGHHYPAWQFGLEGLEDVLDALRERDGWERLSFFLNPNDLLGERTPLEVLRKGKKRVTEVVKAAQVYGEHGS